MAADDGAHPGVAEPRAGEPENLRGGRAEGTPDRRDERHSVKRGAASGASEARDEKPPEKRTRWPLIALGIVIVLGLIGGAIYWWLTRNQISTDDAYTDGRAVMNAPHV